jgi:hypothetical protein
MFEIGHEFKRDGLNYIVLDIINLESRKYILFGIEGTKLDYVFYEATQKNDEIELEEVVDNKIKKRLFDIFYTKNN